jgi:hypothetical protein
MPYNKSENCFTKSNTIRNLIYKVKPYMSVESTSQARLIQFLREELAVPSTAIAFALRQPEQGTNVLPMVLWQYGLITIEQLDQVFDWMETV